MGTVVTSWTYCVERFENADDLHGRATAECRTSTAVGSAPVTAIYHRGGIPGNGYPSTFSGPVRLSLHDLEQIRAVRAADVCEFLEPQMVP